MGRFKMCRNHILDPSHPSSLRWTQSFLLVICFRFLLTLLLLLLLASRHQFTLLGALHSSGREEPRPHQRLVGARDQKNRRATGARNETATDYGMILGAVDLLLLLLVLMVLMVRIMVDMETW